MTNEEQTQKELEQFLLQFDQKQLTEELVNEQINQSLQRLEDLHREVALVTLDLSLQFSRMKAVYKKDNNE
jgi:hypothetical protein